MYLVIEHSGTCQKATISGDALFFSGELQSAVLDTKEYCEQTHKTIIKQNFNATDTTSQHDIKLIGLLNGIFIDNINVDDIKYISISQNKLPCVYNDNIDIIEFYNYEFDKKINVINDRCLYMPFDNELDFNINDPSPVLIFRYIRM